MQKVQRSFQRWLRLMRLPECPKTTQQFWLWLSAAHCRDHGRQPWLMVKCAREIGREIEWREFDVAGRKVWGVGFARKEA